MQASRPFHILMCLTVALSVSVTAFWADEFRAKKAGTETGLAWARQLVTQAEAMALSAREKNEKDPILWAVQFMSQSVQPRMMKITKLTGGLGGLSETYRIRENTPVFEYSKVFTPQDGSGFSLQVLLAYQGFLGSQTQFGSDLSKFIFFISSFFLSYGFFARIFGSTRDSSGLKSNILDWARRAKEGVTQLGLHIRDLVREAHAMTEAAGKTREAVSRLQEKLHEKVNALHDGRKSLREAQQLLMQTEIQALNLIAEVSRFGKQSDPVVKTASDLHAQMRKISAGVLGAERAVRQVELEMEPCCTDADQALHACDSFFESTQKLSQHVRSTTQSILEHSRATKSLEADAEKDSA